MVVPRPTFSWIDRDRKLTNFTHAYDAFQGAHRPMSRSQFRRVHGSNGVSLVATAGQTKAFSASVRP